MLLRLLARLLWGTTKLSVRYVIIPIAVSAATAAVATALADKLREGAPVPNGHVEPVVKPGR